MKSKITAGLYALLIIFASVSMVYYVSGVVALREEFFHAGRYSENPFDFRDDGQTLDGVRKEAQAAGLSTGDFVLAVNGDPFTGFAQIHYLVKHSRPGTVLRVSVRTPAEKMREVQFRLAARQGPNFSLGGYIAFLVPILGVPLLGLLILLRGSHVFHLQQALGMEFGGAVALDEGSATIQKLERTNQPATVYHHRPEAWFTDAGGEEKALLREINAELLLMPPSSLERSTRLYWGCSLGWLAEAY